jgi:hypothetical protein
MIWSEIHKLINPPINNDFVDHWKESINISIYKEGDKTDCSNYSGIPLLLAHICSLLVRSTYRCRITSVGFNIT